MRAQPRGGWYNCDLEAQTARECLIKIKGGKAPQTLMLGAQLPRGSGSSAPSEAKRVYILYSPMDTHSLIHSLTHPYKFTGQTTGATNTEFGMKA